VVTVMKSPMSTTIPGGGHGAQGSPPRLSFMNAVGAHSSKHQSPVHPLGPHLDTGGGGGGAGLPPQSPRSGHKGEGNAAGGGGRESGGGYSGKHRHNKQLSEILSGYQTEQVRLKVRRRQCYEYIQP
jgi:hypothetical protein